jgi:hypothetical protein
MSLASAPVTPSEAAVGYLILPRQRATQPKQCLPSRSLSHPQSTPWHFRVFAVALARSNQIAKEAQGKSAGCGARLRRQPNRRETCACAACRCGVFGSSLSRKSSAQVSVSGGGVRPDAIAGHNVPVTPDERAPSDSWLFLCSCKVCSSHTCKAPDFPGLGISCASTFVPSADLCLPRPLMAPAFRS